MLIALPVNLLTLGLFILVINTWMIMLTDLIVPGIHMPGFWVSLATSILVLLLNRVMKGLTAY